MSFSHRCWIRVRDLSKYAFQPIGATSVALLILRVFLADYSWHGVFERWIATIMLLVSAIYGFLKSRPVRFVTSREPKSELRVKVKIGDVFQESGVLIVGTNTTFDTNMNDETISSTSIQGKYTDRFFPARVHHLDRQLDAALEAVPVIASRTAEEKPYGKRNVYPMGTVVSIHAGKQKAYFCAMAHFNATKRAQVSDTEFLEALPLLWNGIRDQPGMEDLVCPLLGAKHARLSATRLQLLGELVRSLIAANRIEKITDNFTIVITREDQVEGQIDMEAIGRWLEHECASTFTMTGTPRDPNAGSHPGD